MNFLPWIEMKYMYRIDSDELNGIQLLMKIFCKQKLEIKLLLFYTKAKKITLRMVQKCPYKYSITWFIIINSNYHNCVYHTTETQLCLNTAENTGYIWIVTRFLQL